MNSLNKTILLIGIIGGAIWILLSWLCPPFAAYGEALIGTALFLIALKAIDVFWLKTLDIVEEIKNGNVALSIFIGSLFIAFMHYAASVVSGGKPL